MWQGTIKCYSNCIFVILLNIVSLFTAMVKLKLTVKHGYSVPDILKNYTKCASWKWDDW